MTAESLRIAFQNADSSLRSEFNLTAESLRIAFQNADASLRSSIQAEAGRIGLLVEGYGNDATVRRASIVLAINNGTSSAHIDADEVYIGNQKSTTVINGKCVLSDVTADYIAGKIATIPTLRGITANFSGNITSGGALSGNQVYADSRNISNPVMYVSLLGPTNNVYTLVATKADGTYNEMTFSRAVSSWTMGWSGGKFTAKANPQNQSCNTTLVQGTVSWDGNVATVPVNAYDSDNPNYTYATGRSVVVDATSIYNNAAPSRGSAGARSGSTYDWSFVITKGDGTTKTLTIDCTSIYSDARSGYTLGRFTLADITLQGDPDTVYKEVSSGGTNYYTAGTEVTVYPGDGGSFTVQGSEYGDITPIGSAVWFKQHSSSETPSGTWYTYHTSDPGGTTYKRFAAGAVIKNLRNPGTVTKYARGTGYNITPIGTAKMLAATTRYKAGTRYQNTYYTKS